MPIRLAVAAALLLTSLMPAGAVESPPDEVKVRVERRGELVVVDVQAPVAVPHQVAWDVLTDYDHMGSFVSNLTRSAVLKREGNVWEVEQNTDTRFGPFRFQVGSVRRMELQPPTRIRATLISGDFKSFSYTTELRPAADGTLLVVNHGEYEPKAWMPPLIGPSVLVGQTRRTWEQLLAEMRRRAVAQGH